MRPGRAGHERTDVGHWLAGQATRIGISIRGLYVAVAAPDSLLESVGMRALRGEEPVAYGNDYAMSTPFNTFPTGRGSIAILCL